MWSIERLTEIHSETERYIVREGDREIHCET